MSLCRGWSLSEVYNSFGFDAEAELSVNQGPYPLLTSKVCRQTLFNCQYKSRISFSSRDDLLIRDLANLMFKEKGEIYHSLMDGDRMLT